MAYGFRASLKAVPAEFVLHAIVASLSSILLIVSFILLRRWARSRYFRRRDMRVGALRERWGEILEGTYTAKQWSSDPVDREIIENMLLDSTAAAEGEELAQLQEQLCQSGAIQRLMKETHKARGSRRKAAILALGASRIPEAIPVLAECLDSAHAGVRMAAVRGLGRIAVPQAGLPILERLSSGSLRVARVPLQNALLSCCRTDPSLLIPYLRAGDAVRHQVSRVLAELAGPELSEELRDLASDPHPEVRACAARGLARCDIQFSAPILSELRKDEVWFVRLRAVVALGEFDSNVVQEPLILSLRDTNRMVRQCAASGLVKQSRGLKSTLRRVLEQQDIYGFQAMVSALQSLHRYEPLVRSLRKSAYSHSDLLLLEALEEGRHALMVSAKKEQAEEVVTA